MSTITSNASRSSIGHAGNFLVIGFFVLAAFGLWHARPLSYYFIAFSIVTVIVHEYADRYGASSSTNRSSSAVSKAASVRTLAELLLAISVALGLLILGSGILSLFYFAQYYGTDLSTITSLYNSGQFVNAHLGPLLYCGLIFFALLLMVLNRYLYINEEAGISSDLRQALIAKGGLLIILPIISAGLLFPWAYDQLRVTWIRESKNEIIWRAKTTGRFHRQLIANAFLEKRILSLSEDSKRSISDYLGEFAKGGEGDRQANATKASIQFMRSELQFKQIMSRLTTAEPNVLDKLLIVAQSDEGIAKLTLSDVAMIVDGGESALQAYSASLNHLQYVFESNIPEIPAKARGSVGSAFLKRVSRDFSDQLNPALANGIDDPLYAEKLLDNNLIRSYIVETSRDGQTWKLNDKPVNSGAPVDRHESLEP